MHQNNASLIGTTTPQEVLGQLPRPAIMALTISPIVLMCDSKCTHQNKTSMLDLLTVRVKELSIEISVVF